MLISRVIVTAWLMCSLGVAAEELTPGAPSVPNSGRTGPLELKPTALQSRDQALQNAIKPNDKAYGELVRPLNDPMSAILRATKTGNEMCAIPLSTVKPDKNRNSRLDMDPGIRQNGKQRDDANAMHDFDRINVAPAAPSCSQAWIRDVPDKSAHKEKSAPQK